MIILGLLLLAIGALIIVLGLFTADVDANQVELAGFAVGPEGMFLFGVGAGVAIWWGWWVTKFGTKRSVARRKEQKRLTELSEKLDQVEAERNEESQGKDD